MANRRMGNGNFDGSYTRRPGSGNRMQTSLLGQPPGVVVQQPNYVNQGGGGGAFQGQGQQFGGGPAFGQQNQQRQQNTSFEQSYSRRDKNEFFGDRMSGGYGGGPGGRDSFQRTDFNQQRGVGGGGGGPQFEPARVPRDREEFRSSGGGDGWRQRSPSPRNVNKNFGGQDNYGRRDGNWARGSFDDRQQQGGGGDMGMQRPNQGMNMQQNSNMGQGSGSGPVVMVVPQGNQGNGLMGMVPVQAAQNPFNMNRQQPMQVIVGNLPAFNAEFGQQILAAASARPLGQGMMGGPQMGLMNQQRQHPQQQQQQQQMNRYDRSVAEGGSRSGSGPTGRFSRPSNNQRSSSGRSAVARRSDNTGSVSKIARNSAPTTAATAALRGNRKRTILRDRHGATEEIERKRARTVQNRAKNAVNKAKTGQKNNNSKKKAAAAKKAEAEVKKEEGKESAEGKTEEKKEDEEKAEGEAAEKDENGEAKDEEKKKSKYDEFPTPFLVCKICQKVMSDGASFESHLNGRAHAALVKILEGRFQKRAELLMYESKLGEEEIGIERERQRRAGKSGHTGKGSKNFCKMCDCNYSVNWGTHKVSMGHRILKEYLHPSCRFCSSNFVHRMDWVNHLFSVAHIRKLVELKEQGADLEEQQSTLQDELFCIQLDVGRDERPNNVLTIRSQDYKQPLKEDLKELLKDEKGEIVIPEGEIEIPKEYEENKAYGEDVIMKVEGACCKVCRIYISNVNDVDAHVKSKPHYGMYVSHLKKIVKYREHLKAEEERKIKEEAERVEREKKAAEEAAEKQKKEEEEAAKKQETPMETENATATEATAGDKADVEMADAEATKTPATPAKASPLKSEPVTPAAPATTAEPATPAAETAAKIEPATPAAETVAKTEPVTPAPEATKDEAKAEPSAVAAKTEPAASAKTESPKKPAVPAQQQARGRGNARGNRGGPGTPRGGAARGRGGQQHTPQQRGGGNMRGRTPARGGGDSPNWRGGRGGRGGGRFQR